MSVKVRLTKGCGCDHVTTPLMIELNIILYLTGCQMKCHKDDIDKVDLIQPCVTGEYDISIYIYIYLFIYFSLLGEQDQKKLLLYVKGDNDRKYWLSKLSAITVSTLSRSTSPSL